MMKKNILLASLLLASGSAFAQNELVISNLSVEHKGDKVEVVFNATNNSNKKFNTNNTYTYTPILSKGEQRYAMPSIVFGSRRAKVLNRRKGISLSPFNHKGDTVHYRLNVPYQEWMTDGSLVMDASVAGCCRTEKMRPYFIASHILPKPVEVVEPIIHVAPPVLVASTGKQMADKYSFIAPISQWLTENGKPALDLSLPLYMGKAESSVDQSIIENYLVQNEDGALKIYFTQGGRKIDPVFSSNAQAIKDLLGAVASILGSSDSKISHVVIAGFASPEGSLELNDRLAWDRAQALRDFLSKSTGVDRSKIHLYNGRENWMGLRKLVAASHMDYREEVLDIIDNVSITRGREVKLMELKAGRPYNYMLKHFFPELRHAAYIKIYYEEVDPKKD